MSPEQDPQKDKDQEEHEELVMPLPTVEARPETAEIAGAMVTGNIETILQTPEDKAVKAAEIASEESAAERAEAARAKLRDIS
jgi:hypothetical protein